ncbi:ENV1 protein, partial [Aegotheles bennettii]|nr:ENV1 protein [Aegotheles bennettii]
RKHMCNQTLSDMTQLRGKTQWMLPARSGKWICKMLGVTPCISIKDFNTTHDYCIQVLIVPKIIYHPKEYVLNQQQITGHHLVKREPITALTVAVLLTVGGIRAGTGIASLTQQSSQLKTLRQAVDEDILKLEKSIDALVKSVRSLSEVVLQNRKALDILFMQQGGLCVALKEQCCTYVDYTGVAVDTMAELRKQIEQRQRDYESQQNWYETWFNHSPWLTTLLSTIAGPLILLILGLTFGPCIFNRLIAIVKSRLEAAHLMLVKTKY